MAEPVSSSTPERVARFIAFATLGTLGTTQDLARITLGSIDDADPELVAEETLCLVSTATARAAQVGLREAPEMAAAAVPSLYDLPFTYRDYLVGGAVITQQDPSLLDANEAVYRRLQRKQEFYAVHLPADQFPGERVLYDKMALWMGRISPPKLPESPTERLHRLDLVPTLLTHLKLVLAFARKGSM
ncbi:MAG: hypothetical protein D6685_15590 [Bacteroidetes bacterium]|nr:MAG: hypothetical protein D6685_15590 [Bacteroidota bacterium]